MPTLIGTNDPGERQQNESEEQTVEARDSERDRKKRQCNSVPPKERKNIYSASDVLLK
jgi:hypothetical protein